MPKIALVTGSAKRIGKEIALTLAKDGFDIALHYNHSQQDALQTQNEILKLGRSAQIFKADLKSEEETHALFEQAKNYFGQIDLLINNASIFEKDMVTDCSTGSWNLHMDVNLKAPFILSQKLFTSHPNSHQAHIINIIDQRVNNLTPHFFSYTISKSALWTMTQTMAMAMAPHIQVNAIAPGPTFANSRQQEADFQIQANATPLNRSVGIEDICNSVKFLAHNSSITGEMISVDCGEHLGWGQESLLPTLCE